MRCLLSEAHCCSFPYRQRMKKLARMRAKAKVNQAPSMNFVAAEDRKRPSSVMNMNQTRSTSHHCTRQTISATSATRHVVMKVTKTTQNP